ncbi:MAG: hypothetical protein ACRDIY_05800 [Chloroflexota bacterium]
MKPLPAAPLDYLEVAFLLLFTAFLLTSWAGFTLAEFGLDRPVVVLALGVVGLVVGSTVVFRRRWRNVSPGALAGLGLPILIGAILYFPPDEWILGGLDPGSYVNAGAAIARSGGIVLRSPTLAAMAPAIRQALFPAPASRLPGFYLMFERFAGVVPSGFIVATDRVVPHGFHFYPAVLAFGYGIGGIGAELLVTPVLAIAGLVGFSLLVRRLFGTTVAAIATLFLAIGPAEVWFARYPDAEILAQLLLFGGFLAFVASIDAPGPVLSSVAGLALGCVHLAKIEMLPLPFLIAAWLGYQWLVGAFDRRWLWFVGVYALILAQALLHAALIASWYAVTTLRVATSPRLLLLIGAGALVALAVVALLVLFPAVRWRVRLLVTAGTWEKPAALLFPLLAGALAVYAAYVRPLGDVPLATIQLDAARLAAANNLESFVRLGWYITPLGLVLGTLGWMLLLRGARDRRTILPLMVILADTLIFLVDMKITPVHYWAARRWVPLVIPGFCLAIAYLLPRVSVNARDRFTRSIVPFGLAITMAVGLLAATRPLIGYVEYRGAIRQVAALAATTPDDAVVLLAEGDSGIRFSTPLQYLYGRTSFVIWPDPRMDAAANLAARRWLAAGRPVYWVSTPDLPGPSEIGLSGDVVARPTISLPEKVATRDRPPGEDGVFLQHLEVWKLRQ